MTKPRGAIIAMLIASLAAGGCSSIPIMDPTVCEYPPAKLPSQAKVNEASVFALVQWPATRPATRATDKRSSESSADYLSEKELESDVCVNTDESIGFRVEHAQLIAFAGKTAIPLAAGRYSWILISTPANGKWPTPQKPLDLEEAIWLATVGAAISGAIWWWAWCHGTSPDTSSQNEP